MQTTRRAPAYCVCQSRWSQTCPMQRFVGVDVAHARDRLLVQKHGLQWRATPSQGAIQLVGGEGRVDRFGSEARHLPGPDQLLLGAREQAAEAARVAVTELASVIEEKDRVSVLLARRVWTDQAQLAAHAQVHHQQKLSCEADEDVLAPTAHGFDPHASDRVDELLRLGVTNDRRKRKLTAQDRSPEKVRPQVRDDRLDFGKLRH